LYQNIQIFKGDKAVYKCYNIKGT
jgi:hypothetical protein